MGIWRDLVDQHGFVGAYEAVKRFVRKLRGSHAPEACAVIVTAPGEEAQVDSGTGPMVRDPPTVKYRRTRLFVSTLGCSRKSVRFLVFRSSSQISAELHERAFRRLGGATRVIVLDHLREGVAKLADFPSPALHLGGGDNPSCHAKLCDSSIQTKSTNGHGAPDRRRFLSRSRHTNHSPTATVSSPL